MNQNFVDTSDTTSGLFKNIALLGAFGKCVWRENIAMSSDDVTSCLDPRVCFCDTFPNMD